MLTDAEIIAQVFAAFKAEQVEHRQAIGELLLDLEREPDRPDRRAVLDQLFREAHSLKGGARAAGLVGIEQIAHRIEDIFAVMRQGSLELTPHLCDPIYAAIDAIGVLMEQAAPGSDQPTDAYAELMATLSQAAVAQVPLMVSGVVSAPPLVSNADTPRQPRPPAAIPTPELAPPPPEPQLDEQDTQHAHAPRPAEPTPEQGQRSGQAAGEETVRLAISVLDGLMNEAGELMTCSLRARQLAREAQALQDLPARWRRLWRRISPILGRRRDTALQPVVHHLDDREASEAWASPTLQTRAHHSSIERDALLDALAQANTLIGELSASLSKVARQAAEDQTRLAAVTDRLHGQIRRTRMLPLATLINPLRLQLREMARAAAKHAVLDLDDRGAEADRQVLEQLREVLIHLLRNAIDHGIETPEARLAAGKPEQGTITLSAAASGDRLTITIVDDGAGLDLEAIGRRARSTGLIGPGEGETSPTDLASLIFLPGFSTRQTVSTLSGRGVGLDVVRSRVERMHGRVSVRSKLGAGAAFTIDVPLSLTSSHGLLLRSGGSEYVLPLEAVLRIVMPSDEQIQALEGRPVLHLDGHALPLATLGEVLGVAGERSAAAHGLALILGSGDRQVACLVDTVLGEQELVVHRLPAPLARVRFILGATILADGRVVPILDAVDLVRATAGAQHALSPIVAAKAAHSAPVILVADDSITTRTLEKNILEAAGYKVCLATDGQEALEALRYLADNGGCNLLLSDIDMPRLNGFELTIQVRSDPQLRHLPVVLVTSLDSPADRERGVAAGADAYIVKRAFDQQSLLETIAQLV